MNIPKVLLAGGSGLIGRALTHLLISKGCEVSWLSRSSHSERVNVIPWDPMNGKIPEDDIREFDVLINLAGAGIADKRWRQDRKELIIQSRTIPNQLFAQMLRKEKGRLSYYLSSSAIGYYGNSGDRWVTEDDSARGTDFLSASCQAWEEAIQSVAASGIITAWIRTGIVLSTKGGALAKMIPPLRMGLASYFGSGEQYYSWIHIDDLVDMMYFMFTHQLEGPYNGVAPNPVPMKEFAREMANSFSGNQVVLPVPKVALRLMFGEMADVLLTGSRVSSQKIQSKGFHFQFPDLPDALSDLAK